MMAEGHRAAARSVIDAPEHGGRIEGQPVVEDERREKDGC
jgi:hypothetical protein